MKKGMLRDWARSVALALAMAVFAAALLAACGGGAATTVAAVFANREYASPTDTFNAGGCTGFGELVVFDRGAGETEIGERLFA